MSHSISNQKFIPASLMLATIGLCVAAFMQVLDSTIANVALPTIAKQLGVLPTQGAWVITSFTVCNAIGLPLTGWLSRRLGETRLFCGSIILFVIASVLCGMAQNMTQLVIFRALQGFACAPLYPVAQALLLAIFPNNRRGLAFGILSLVITVAPISGPIVGGWLTETFSWPWIFFVNLPIGLFALTLVWVQLRKRPEVKTKASLNYVSLGFLVLGVSLIQIVLDRGNDFGWFQSSFIVVSTVSAVLCVIAFLISELRSKNPIISFYLFKHRNYTIGTAAFILCFSYFFAVNIITPMWVQNHLGYTATLAGLAIAPIGILSLFLSPLVGYFSNRIDMRWVATLAFVAMGTSCFMRTGFTLETSFAAIAWAQFIMGLGSALFFMTLNAISLSELPNNQVADAAGLTTFLRTLGSSFAASLSIWFWTARATTHHIETPAAIRLLNPDLAYHQAYMSATVEYFVLMGLLFFGLIMITWLARPVPNESNEAAVTTQVVE